MGQPPDYREISVLVLFDNGQPKRPIFMFFPKIVCPDINLSAIVNLNHMGFIKKKRKKGDIIGAFFAVQFSIKVIESANICLCYSSLLVSKYDA